MFIPAKPEAYKLFHDGVRALSIIEGNGIRLDVGYVERTLEKVGGRINKMQEELRDSDVYLLWRRTYGERTNLGSREQLGKILYDVMGYEVTARTKSGKPSTDASALESISMEVPFVKHLLQLEKYKKLRSTYLKGLLRETEGEYLHPFFNLHTVRTYRSSSDSPNFQNLPIRDPQLAKLLRRAFIARDEHQLVEIDFSGVEVRIAACYNKDPELIKEITDPSKDMHRDMAGECFMLEPEQVTKKMRYCGKNMFVFPQFYGSYFAQCAPNLWEAIGTFKFEVGDKTLYEHLRSRGITELGQTSSNYDTGRIRSDRGSYVEHIRKVETRFWEKRFKVYAQWKKRWYASYLKQGGFTTLTGFRCEGLMKRNDVSNYPIQGSAFHCLLACLIEVQRRLRKKKMRSLLVGQIHDSIVADVHNKELDGFLKMAVEVMTQWLPRRFDWINVPIDVEAEVCPVGGTWHDKKEVEL